MLPTSSQTMTSKEIADLVESRHADVKRSIERLAEKGVISKPPMAFSEEINNLGLAVKREHYVFDAAHKRDTYVVVAQLSPEFTARIVDRWQELEGQIAAPVQPASPITAPEQAATAALEASLKAAELLRVPLHLAQIESVKAVRLAHHVDYSPLLAHAPAQTDVPATEVMLEPTELAQRLGVKSAKAMNAILRDHGLQVRRNGEWMPTERGEPLCVRHAWVKGEKSGYNLKWRLSPIRKALAPKLVDQSA